MAAGALKAYNDFISKLYDENREKEKFAIVAKCESGYCSTEEITRSDVGNNDVAVNLSGDVPVLYHRDCCPCTGDQSELNNLWLRLGLSDDEGNYYGELWLCPFCFRIYDDNGNEVHPD